MRLPETIVAGWIVVVRTHGLRNSPVGDGQVWIQFGSSSKRACCFFVIEGVNQPESLIEELLCFGVLCGDGVMKVTQARCQNGWLGRAVSRMILSQ
jgi:hypothetical protein